MTCRTVLGHRERRPGECCRLCTGFAFGECRKVDMIGSRQVDPDFWCPSFALRPSLAKAARLGPVIALRE